MQMSDSYREILDKLNTIEEKINLLRDNLNERLDLVQDSHDDLNERLEKIEASTVVMDEHVQWVNDVHNVVKKPLFTALNAVNSIVSPFSETMVDIEEVPDAPAYQRSLTHVKEKE